MKDIFQNSSAVTLEQVPDLMVCWGKFKQLAQ